MIVIQCIENIFAVPAGPYQMAGPQQPQLVADRRLAGAQQLCNIINAHLCFGQSAHNADTCAVRKNLEQLCQLKQIILAGKMGAGKVRCFFMIVLLWNQVFFFSFKSSFPIGLQLTNEHMNDRSFVFFNISCFYWNVNQKENFLLEV